MPDTYSIIQSSPDGACTYPERFGTQAEAFAFARECVATAVAKRRSGSWVPDYPVQWTVQVAADGGAWGTRLLDQGTYCVKPDGSHSNTARSHLDTAVIEHMVATRT